MHSKCTAWGCRIMVSVGKSSPLSPLCLLRARSILGCHCLWWFVLQLHQVFLGPAPGVLGIAAAHLPMDLETFLQPSLPHLQPEGFGDF